MKISLPISLCILLSLYSQGQQRVIVVNAGSDSATVLNPSNHVIIKSIPTKLRPQDVRVSPEGKQAYILNMGSSKEPGNTISVFDLEEYVLKSTIDLGIYTRPHWSKMSSNGKLLWVACANQNAILEVDLENEKVSKVWDTKQPGSYNFTVSPDEAKIYTANFDTTTVSIINRKTSSVNIVDIGGKPIGADASPNTNEIWISSDKTNEIVIFDSKSDVIISRFPSGGSAPCRLKITHDGKYALVTHGLSKDISVYFTNEKKLAWKTDLNGVFPKGLAISPDDKYALVSLVGGDEVLTIDLEKGEVIKRLRTGKNPEGLVYFQHTD
jgi:DNA-binding beta-propeller fold protein YncE